MRWKVILEEYSSELRNIQDSQNIAADALSRLDIVDAPNPVKNHNKAVNEHYGLEDEHISHPANYKTIMQNQQKDKELTNIAQDNKDYSIQNVYGVDKKYSLFYRKYNTVIPKQLENQVVEWYHNALSYPGEKRTELSIAPHFY